MAKPIVHLVEDDPVAQTFLAEVLRSRYEVVTAASCQEARRALVEAKPTAVVLDFRLPDGDALSLLPDYRRVDPSISILIASGKNSPEIAAEAMRLGARRFLIKPLQPQELIAILGCCLAQEQEPASD